tara:strand:+ start:2655 stop:2993 length:339 start_codon:yes stop_codon:yes gene_type:complete
MYKLRGRITEIKDTQIINTKNGDAEIHKFILEETESGFNHTYMFEIFGKEKKETMPKYKIEDYATITFYIKSRQWNDKFYYSLHPHHINVEDNTEFNSVEDKKFAEKNEMPF